jgi:uncharacterized protein (DUF2126 family)/transglutaminase-like putative cysteine protease
MSITVALHHKTRYSYDRPVKLTPQVVRLRPAPHCRTPIRAYSLKVRPEPHFVNWQQDPFGNYQARLVFPHETSFLEVEVDLLAEMTAINPFDFFLEESAERFPFTYDAEQRVELAPYLVLAPAHERFAAFVADAQAACCKPGRRTVDVLVDLNRQVRDALRYDVRMEPGVFAPDETLERGHGSCRDFSWLLVQLLRRVGLAARFVSGYSIQLVADVKPIEGPAGVPADVTDLHAWAEVYVPGAGWIGLDSTSGLLCAEGHIPLACTADPSSAAPISGGYLYDSDGDDDKVRDQFSFEMGVQRIAERPRVTKPYSDETWREIESLGHLVDARLVDGDVRLSMGGEPTFVAIDDPDGPEWNVAALGPRKRVLGERLIHRLQARFAPGGLVHYGQGKWYPGEPLPRWAMTCYFRRDGAPVWRRAELVAREGSPAPGPEAADALIRTLARRLEVGEENVVSAYEDLFYYLWRERRLPVNVDPFKSRLEDPIERARLARVFEQGLGTVVGHVLPLEVDYGRGPVGHWRSGSWPVRGDRLFLLPGDSPMGYRLPLDALPWVSKELRPEQHDPDPFAPRAPLAPPTGAVAGGRGLGPGFQEQRSPSPTDVNDPEWPAGMVRTALCTEVRDGILNVFLPPLYGVEAYLSLVSAIEASAAEVGVPVRVEGYPPPRDPRVGQFAVTPDPGVIEVNIQPATSWDEISANTTALYEEARQVGLGTEKFMIDGRHTGTGGGNHVVLGGMTAADSPFLRRPDLLRSLIAYFINHPSLSYFFSGLFVGPTSQAPRVDEARQETVDEMEVAFRQIDDAPPGAPTPPWLVDRVFRHLLTDITGNTHRTELCIDKMFSPDSAAGRQGLLELRSFEMPPHPQMSLTQQLLLRALVAAFWKEPYRRAPARWGTALHDRFLLPHFLAQDLDDVVGDLRRAGIPMQSSWFTPHFEFRFPLAGTAAVRGLTLELRQAVEPWHVLGEEVVAAGTARYVDSSVERLEVKVRGFSDDRYFVACNGFRVPLHPTGTSGEMVAGVRYRAWQPPSALHPRIGVHAPLTFDVVDTWSGESGKSVGGCTYHVSHPGGRALDERPRTALEAEGRRLARFFTIGHTPGPIPERAALPAPTAKGFPMTLDLRRG